MLCSPNLKVNEAEKQFIIKGYQHISKGKE